MELQPLTAFFCCAGNGRRTPAVVALVPLRIELQPAAGALASRHFRGRRRDPGARHSRQAPAGIAAVFRERRSGSRSESALQFGESNTGEDCRGPLLCALRLGGRSRRAPHRRLRFKGVAGRIRGIGFRHSAGRSGRCDRRANGAVCARDGRHCGHERRTFAL